MLPLQRQAESRGQNTRDHSPMATVNKIQEAHQVTEDMTLRQSIK
jgi:hypothetical protein